MTIININCIVITPLEFNVLFKKMGNTEFLHFKIWFSDLAILFYARFLVIWLSIFEIIKAFIYKFYNKKLFIFCF